MNTVFLVFTSTGWGGGTGFDYVIFLSEGVGSCLQLITEGGGVKNAKKNYYVICETIPDPISITITDKTFPDPSDCRSNI